MNEQGRMLPGIDLADIHGQDKFNFQHAAIRAEDSNAGWIGPFAAISNSTDPAFTASAGPRWKAGCGTRTTPIRACGAFSVGSAFLRDGYAAALWAMEKHLRRTNEAVSQRFARCAKTWAGNSDCSAA